MSKRKSKSVEEDTAVPAVPEMGRAQQEHVVDTVVGGLMLESMLSAQAVGLAIDAFCTSRVGRLSISFGEDVKKVNAVPERYCTTILQTS
jgi:hypothetical protein